MGIFSGLEKFGLGKLKDTELYKEEKTNDKANENNGQNKPAIKHEVTEEELLFDKTYTCPVCYKEFKTKAVRTGKAKLLSADTDLRPKFQTVDSLKYEAIVCPHCGYAALTRFFEHIISVQAKFVREEISSNFNGLEIKGEAYTYDEAIARYKLALLNTVVKKGKASEKAYTCLKLAWVIRGKAETLPKDTENYEDVLKELKNEEDELIQNAYEGFSSSFTKESFPICGMDELTVTYLIADLARRSKQFDIANRWVSQVITSRTANERIKNKAREIKELIKEDMELLEENTEA